MNQSGGETGLAPAVATRVRAAVAASAATGGLCLVNPNTTHVPLCPLHAMTGLWCPFCGSVRASYALLHADISAAARDNLMFVTAAPLLAVAVLRWFCGATIINVAGRIPKAGWVVLGAVLLAFTVSRNLAVGASLAP